MIQSIALQWPAGSVRDRYVTAAANFRIPYWDWAVVPPDGQSVLPVSISGSDSISVDGPAGNQTIANPLFSYEFKPLNTTELPDAPLSQWNQTLRYPTTQDSSAVSQNDLVAQQLDNSAASFRNRLYNLFINSHDYANFSNEAWIPSDDNSGDDSIESIHDQVHGLIGSGGHMTYIDYSAFDPIFFLHHTMVDRCFTMWEVLNPDSYVVPEAATYSTMTTSAGQIQNSTTALTPFHDDVAGDFWTSDAVRTTGVFGYSYAETANSTGADIRANVIAAINTLYGTTAPSSTVTKVKRAITDRELALNTSLPIDLAPDGQYREWIANIRVKKQALGAPFYVHIFLGSFSSDPFSWSFEPNLVGTHFIFTTAPSSLNSCESCNPDQMVAGTIPLTSALLEAIEDGELSSLDPVDVEQYLMQNMQYRVSLLNDTAVANTEVPSLQVSVSSSVVQRNTNQWELPVWGAIADHLNIPAC